MPPSEEVIPEDALIAYAAGRVLRDLAAYNPTAQLLPAVDGDGEHYCVLSSVEPPVHVPIYLVLDEAASCGEATLALAESVLASSLFDDETEPWPRCPFHRDHSLTPQVERGRAVWRCIKGASARIPVGDLGSLAEPHDARTESPPSSAR